MTEPRVVAVSIVATVLATACVYLLSRPRRGIASFETRAAGRLARRDRRSRTARRGSNSWRSSLAIRIIAIRRSCV